jgi:hypothetical protein
VLRFLSPAVGALLALAAALAAACFVRVFGIAYLGRPRSSEAALAHEASQPQLVAMGILAGLCALGGLFGGVAVWAIQPLLLNLTGAVLPSVGSGPTPFSLVAFDAARSTYDAPTIAVFLLMSGLAITAAIHRFAGRSTRRAPAWDCCFPEASPLTQYTASSFAQPLRRVYGSSVFGAVELVDMPPPGDVRPSKFGVRLHDYVWNFLYEVPAAAILRFSAQLNKLQFLTIRSYLMLMFAALIVLLLIAAVWF